MAKLSNINGKFAVEDTGAIRFSDQTGTTGQILKSNGNAAPTWVDGSTVIGGPYLPLAGGILTGATSTASGISFTVGGALTGTTAGFSGSITASGNSNSFGNTTIAALSASTGTFSASVTAAGNSNSFGNSTFTGNVGIGGSPTFKLDVLSNGTSLRLNSSDANGAYITWANNGTAIGYVGSGYHLWGSPNNIATSLGIRAQTRLDLGIQASVHMTILNTGNVGIGDTTPQSRLQVRGSALGSSVGDQLE